MNTGETGEALHRTRTDDPFLTMDSGVNTGHPQTPKTGGHGRLNVTRTAGDDNPRDAIVTPFPGDDAGQDDSDADPFITREIEVPPSAPNPHEKGGSGRREETRTAGKDTPVDSKPTLRRPFDQLLLGLHLEPTIAMCRGDQLIWQCAECGLLAVQTNLAPGRLAQCPACAGARWWKQDLPVGGLNLNYDAALKRVQAATGCEGAPCKPGGRCWCEVPTLAALGLNEPPTEATRMSTEDALVYLVDRHHRTLTGSRKHDPENRDWTDCECKTCEKVRHVLPTARVLAEREQLAAERAVLVVVVLPRKHRRRTNHPQKRRSPPMISRERALKLADKITWDVRPPR